MVVAADVEVVLLLDLFSGRRDVRRRRLRRIVAPLPASAAAIGGAAEDCEGGGG